MSIRLLVLPKKLCAKIKIHLLPLVILITAGSTTGSTTSSAHHVTSPAMSHFISTSVINMKDSTEGVVSDSQILWESGDGGFGALTCPQWLGQT